MTSFFARKSIREESLNHLLELVVSYNLSKMLSYLNLIKLNKVKLKQLIKLYKFTSTGQTSMLKTAKIYVQ